jgi:predicted metal-dependent peptidase
MSNIPIAIDRARWWALSNKHVVFYGSLASHLIDVVDESIQTAETDGNVIRWNPKFVASLSDKEVRFVLLHEAMHCAHGHLWRLPPNAKGNKAGDYAINATLRKIDGIDMPKGALYDPQFEGLAEEEILGRIPEDDDGGKGDDPGGCGGFTEPAPTASGGQSGQPVNQPPMQEKWERAVIQADQVSRSTGAGNAPADMQQVLDRVRATDIDWRQEVVDFARTAVASRSDWSRSSRRHATAPVIYPRRKRDDVGTIIVVRDTSGSIDKPLCDEFSAQVTAMCADLNCSAIVLDCDTKVHAEYRIDPGSECPLKVIGGGGTDFRAAFDCVRRMIDDGESIAGMIYLTDLDGAFPDEPADYPVLWAAYGTRATAPFGRTIHVK